jgi:hypothetical protein
MFTRFTFKLVFPTKGAHYVWKPCLSQQQKPKKRVKYKKNERGKN